MSLKNQKGISLVEMMVVIGFLGLVALLGSQLVIQTSNMSKKMEYIAELESFSAEMTYFFGKKTTCMDNFFEKKYSGGEEELSEIVDEKGKVILSSGKSQFKDPIGPQKPFMKDYYIYKITLKEITKGSDYRIFLRMKKFEESSLGLKEITRNFRVFMNVQGNEVQECNTGLALEKNKYIHSVCKELGGIVEMNGDCTLPTYDLEIPDCPGPPDSTVNHFLADFEYDSHLNKYSIICSAYPTPNFECSEGTSDLAVSFDPITLSLGCSPPNGFEILGPSGSSGTFGLKNNGSSIGL